jgi:chromosome segregation ATPase
LITSLRNQLTALSEQSHQLNTKLVASISRHADLEDQHYNLQNERDELRGKNAELTKVKETWENSMKTGLYVEQSQIKEEMQRLAAGLVEEERKRGSAEQRRQDVENEVDELATSLFEQVCRSSG